MEMLETQIKKFLRLSDGSDYGNGSGAGYGSGDNDGSGAGYGAGYGSGDGYLYGDDSDYGDGDGEGNGDGSGEGYGDGSGEGYGIGVKEINGDTVYRVDDIPTIIKSVRDNIAQGLILHSDLSLQPCYIVKEQNRFAHGKTLHDAFTALQEKLYDNSTKEERIEAFRKKFPEYDTPYSNRDLFVYHHVLTGSCKMGRDSFCMDKGINLDGSTTIREFVNLTKDSYGSDIIRKLPEVYGIEE